MKFSIVIPVFDHFDLTGQILMDIYQNCPTVDEVIVVDDCSQKTETFDGYKFWKNMMPALKVLELSENLGFLRASNRGLQEATGDIVALISNDVRIKKDLPKLVKEIIKTPLDKILLGGRMLDFDTGWNVFNEHTYMYIEGWALIATKSGWEELGHFDEKFAPHDYEDVDLSTTAVSKGFMLRVFPPWHGEVLEHIGAQSIGYNDKRFAVTEAHRELFRQKWVTKVNP